MDQSVYFPTLDQYKLSSAVALQAAEDEPVVAASNGIVYSIEESAQTGTTVTMELGNGYQAIYGQLKDLMVSEGEVVEEGSVIGYISAPTKYYSLEGSNLYFAMKKDGEPIDPILYLP
jgi:murein DD-endopeptidase MepM/ murein hydrolase activator NlpD